MRVPDEETKDYGIIKPISELSQGLYDVEQFVEKPDPKDAPSNLAIIGRYLLTPEIFDLLQTQKPGKGNEIQLTDAIDRLNLTQRVFAHEFTGERFDVGNKFGYLKTMIRFGLHNPEIKDDLTAYLKEVGKKQVTLNLLTDDTDQDKHTGEYIQSVAQKNLKGLKVTMTSIPHAQHVSRDFAGNFEMNLTGWSTNWLDASDFLGLGTSTNQVNFAHLKNAKFDSLMNQSNHLSGQARYNKLVQADKYFTAFKGYVPLYQPAQANLISKHVGGLKYSLLNDAQYQYAYWK